MTRPLAALLAALGLVGCTSPPTGKGLCPRYIDTRGGYGQGQLNGSDLYLSGPAGERDGVDSNFAQWWVEGGITWEIGTRMEHCPAWGGGDEK